MKNAIYWKHIANMHEIPISRPTREMLRSDFSSSNIDFIKIAYLINNSMDQ